MGDRDAAVPIPVVALTPPTSRPIAPGEDPGYRSSVRFGTTILQARKTAMGFVVPGDVVVTGTSNPDTRARRIEKSIAALRAGRIR